MLRSMNRVLIIGGNGALGRSVVSTFKASWEVTSVDFSANPEADKSVVFPMGTTGHKQALHCREQLYEGKRKYKAILCFAGGFGMGPVEDPDVFDQTEEMMTINLTPSLLTAHIATYLLADNGTLLFTGANAVFKEATPGLFGYGLAKTAVHGLALNMAAREAIPSDAVVTTILPGVINTKANRDAMPNEDQSDWHSPSGIAGLVKMWADGHNRPENGSFALLKNEGGSVVPEFV